LFKLKHSKLIKVFKQGLESVLVQNYLLNIRFCTRFICCNNFDPMSFNYWTQISTPLSLTVTLIVIEG